MLISIVTPSFNSAKYIEDCIKSVFEQNYHNYEHIIIDGGSIDGTIEILKKYSHLKWISETDMGQSDALNKGFKIARGDIIGWLNSDDYLLGGTLHHVSNLFHKGQFDILYGSFVFINDVNKYMRLMPSLKPNKWLLKNYGCYLPTSGAFYHRNIFHVDRILLDTSLKVLMDLDFYIRLIDSNKRLMMSRLYFNVFRLHDENQSKLLIGTESLKLFIKYGSKNYLRLAPKTWFHFVKIFSRIVFVFFRFISGSYFNRWTKSKDYSIKKSLKWF